MPVVWCTDPNSSEKRQPFALQGIQLQGNITEKHVLAMKELISAASEGRLLLPSDGAIVLLDCGLSIGSMVIEGKAGKEAAREAAGVSNHKSILPVVPEMAGCGDDGLQQKYADDQNNNANGGDRDNRIGDRCEDEEDEEQAFLTELAEDECKPLDLYGCGGAEGGEFLYEFLCCAKCMNDPSSSCFNPPSHRSRSLNSLNNKSQLLSRFLNGRAKARLYCDPLYNISNRYFKRLAKASKIRSDSRRNVIRKSSIRSDRSSGGKIVKKSSENIPIYATVNKKMKLRSRLEALRRQNIDADTLALQIALDKQQLIKSRSNPTTALSEIHNQSSSSLSPLGLLPPLSPGKPYNSSSRKTSFDSTCTVSSMDSGFIDQQQRQQLKQLQQQLQQQKQGKKSKEICQPSESITVKASPSPAEKECCTKKLEELPSTNDGDVVVVAGDEDRLNELSQLQIKECLVTQSRNRRKSYEEFKSLFRQQQQQQTECRSRLAVVNEKDPQGNAAPHANHTSNNISSSSNDSIKTRRKSYEEFKASVKICDSSVSNLKPTSEEEETTEEDHHHHTALSGVSGLFKMKRKNSRRLSLKKLKMHDKADPTQTATAPADKLAPSTVISNSVSKISEESSHVKSSTIYDILRTKNKPDEHRDSVVSLSKDLSPCLKEELYRKNYKIYDKLISYGSRAYKKYDKYMTYGTIYEILHRKSDAAEDIFLRKRALSEKFAKRKHSVSSHYSSLKFGTIYDILQSRNAALTAEPEPSENTSSKAPETESPTNSTTLSTIYDIIHKKADSPKQQTKNRFLVKKITEEELRSSNENNRNELNTPAKSQETPPSPDYTTPKTQEPSKKPTRARRFSNILSYSPRQSSPITDADSSKLSNSNGSRLKKIAASDEDLYKRASSKHHHHHHHKSPPPKSNNDDELYSRIGRLRKSATESNALCDKIQDPPHQPSPSSSGSSSSKVHHFPAAAIKSNGLLPQPGAIFKSNSLDMLAPSKFARNPRWSRQQGAAGPVRKLSPLVLPRKSGSGSPTGGVEKQQKKSTRRLSEFTRGEFLNEKL